MEPARSGPDGVAASAAPAGSAAVPPPSSVSKSGSERPWRLPPRYEVKSVIGTGSYGSVCEAYDREQSRLVAVKRVRHLFDDLVDCKRILREVAILSRLRHECIVQIYNVLAPGPSVSFDELYIIMEICDSDLKKLCRTDVTLTPLHINTLLYNLLVGVKYLHSAGIYHRDLKPANCLVNQDCSVKICDFGLARAVGGDPPGDHLPPLDPRMPLASGAFGATSAPGSGGAGAVAVATPLGSRRHLTGHVVTRWYRAPELILLQENYTSAIDLRSVGCIYAELLGMLEGTRMEDRGPLFPGTSCFPLSPDNKHKTDYKYHTKGKHDQLSMIFNLLGTPTDAEVAELEREDARRYIQCFAKRAGEGLRRRFPHPAPESIHFLMALLCFSPRERLTVEQALRHPLFGDIRDPARETSASAIVSLDFEKEPDLDEGLLRRYFLKEMRKYNGEDCGFRHLGS